MTVAAVVTVSDGVSAGRRADRSGDAAESKLAAEGFEVTRSVVADDEAAITTELARLITAEAPLIVTTGGTGLGPRDVTPEATRAVLDRDAPGLAEVVRHEGLKSTPFASLSRGVSGVAGRSLIVNLPGSTAGVEEGLDAVLPVIAHALKMISGDTEH